MPLPGRGLPVSQPEAASAEGPPRRRESWSLKTLVEEAAGRPIGDLVDPEQPLHPYLRVKMGSDAPTAGRTAPIAGAGPEPDALDPVDRIHPPLTGATGRRLHGPQHEHHPETLGALDTEREPIAPGIRPHPPGPSRRPERIYLHYLLLHLDRLSDSALRYLAQAVREEIDHRDGPGTVPTVATAPMPADAARPP